MVWSLVQFLLGHLLFFKKVLHRGCTIYKYNQKIYTKRLYQNGLGVSIFSQISQQLMLVYLDKFCCLLDNLGYGLWLYCLLRREYVRLGKRVGKIPGILQAFFAAVAYLLPPSQFLPLGFYVAQGFAQSKVHNSKFEFLRKLSLWNQIGQSPQFPPAHHHISKAKVALAWAGN